eukprot:TRINITY_DN4746_c0_g1_i6.p1 TRINITY_DN4746_c0_g1~~TRINITY_DN4746_c0_g1_i6.p1  ORF type:complete len:316 (-),score=60.69 TRINITY_DN4746_c0_g1_i6:108-1055(-)
MATPFPTTRKTFGISKNRTNVLQGYKEDIIRKGSRFGPSKHRTLLDNSQLGKGPLLENKNNDLEMSSSTSGNSVGGQPGWMEHYDEALLKLRRVQSLSEEFLRLRDRRVKYQFGNQSDLDGKLETLMRNATESLSECERCLNAIAVSGTPDETEQERRFRLNLQKSLAYQIQENARSFRRHEKGLYDFLVKFHSSGFKEPDNKASVNFDDNMEEMAMEEDLDQQRDTQINKMVESLNKLATLFKDLNHVVVEQGTLLDRIDYNVEQTLFNTRKAVKELVKANEYHQSNLARKCQFVLTGLIFFFLIVLFLKYTSR